MVKGALIGAAGGALIGALASGGSDVGRNAAIGALAGAAAGAAAGYWQHKMQQDRDQAVLSVKSDLMQEIGQIDKANQAFAALTDCRKKQFARIKEDYAAKRIDRSQATAQWTAQRGYLDRDLKLAAMVDEKMVARGENYDFANEQVNGPLPPDSVAMAQPAAPVASPPSDSQTGGPASKSAPVKKAPTKPAATAPATKPKVAAKEPELASLTATRQHKAGEFKNTLQVAKSLNAETQQGFTDTGLLKLPTVYDRVV